MAAAAGPAPSVLRVVSAADAGSLDPALAGDPLAWAVHLATCMPLVTFPADARGYARGVAPAAAALPRVSTDGTTYVFTVRPGLRFSDGTPLTAANYATAIVRTTNPAMRSNHRAFADDIERVSARGRSLTVKLSRPAGDILARLTMPWACPVPTDLPADPVGVETIPGSGAFSLASRTVGREIVLRRNRHYAGPSPGRVDEIRITIAGTPTSNALAVEDGLYDFSAQSVPQPLVEGLAARHGVNRGRFVLQRTTGTVFLALNTERPLFRNNAHLRRAVNFALDRAEIVRQGGYLAARRTDQLVPPGLPGFKEASIYPLGGPALRTARRLARGNLRGGHAVLYVADEPASLRRGEIIRYNLSRIGLQVDVKSFARPVMATRIGTRGEPFDMALTGWFAFYPDPADFLLRILYGGGITATSNYNVSYFDVASVDRRLARARALAPPARYDVMAELEIDVLRRYAPVAPLMNPLAYAVLSPRVGCFQSHPFYGPLFSAFCLK